MSIKMKRFFARNPLHIWVFRLVLVVLALVYICPILFAIITSLKTEREFYSNIWALPQNIRLENYISAFKVGKIGEYFGNSVIIAIGSIIPIEICAVLLAYAIARLKLPKTELILIFCFAIQLLPTETIIIPLYITMSKLSILSVPYMPMILAYAGWSIPGTAIIMKNYFDTVPSELLEAARIDGAGEVTTLFRVMLPLMKGVLATCIVMNFTFVWGEMMWARTATIVTTKGIPLTVGLMNFKSDLGTQWPLLCAAICLVIIPLYLLFLFLQKYFVASLTAGGVKG
ncbi:MAG TPA: carbohydrate ABC transporter permease [Clostridiales bacterium]|nr:carbohydrate ABC transporter permease [Clostridiales bacterium]